MVRLSCDIPELENLDECEFYSVECEVGKHCEDYVGRYECHCPRGKIEGVCGPGLFYPF